MSIYSDGDIDNVTENEFKWQEGWYDEPEYEEGDEE